MINCSKLSWKQIYEHFPAAFSGKMYFNVNLIGRGLWVQTEIVEIVCPYYKDTQQRSNQILFI